MLIINSVTCYFTMSYGWFSGLALKEYKLSCTGWIDEGDLDIWQEVPAIADGQNSAGVSV